MKKIFKKAIMLLCAMLVTIGFVGGNVEEVSAAKLYGGESTIFIDVPFSFSQGRLDIETNLGKGRSVKINSVGQILNCYIEGYATKKNAPLTIKVKYYDNKNKLVANDSIKVKANDLGKKNFKVKLKTKLGNCIKKVSIKKL